MRLILTPEEAKATERFIRETEEGTIDSVWEVDGKFKNIISVTKTGEGLVIIDTDETLSVTIIDEITALSGSVIPLVKSIMNLFEATGKRIKNIIGRYIVRNEPTDDYPTKYEQEEYDAEHSKINE